MKCPGIFTEESSFFPRKHITELQFESQRSRLTVLLQHIRYIADRERVEEKDIASLALKLISTIVHDRKVSKVSTEILQTGTFSNSYKQLPIDKSAFLLDILEIGKRKYSNIRKLCKPEGIIFPSYDHIAIFRSQIALTQKIKFIHKEGQNIGVTHSYFELVKHTAERILQTMELNSQQYPIEFEIADGLDGSGSHRIYNQLNNDPNFTTKSIILYAFKPLTIKDSEKNIIWSNLIPRSPHALFFY